MSLIRKKRDRRNYDTVRFFMTPPKLIIPGQVGSVYIPSGGLLAEAEQDFDRDVEEARQRILRLRRERGIAMRSNYSTQTNGSEQRGGADE